MSGIVHNTIFDISANSGAGDWVPATPDVDLASPVRVQDIASAAITSTTTTSAFTPNVGISYQVHIPVTAVSGTNPTMDIDVQESFDGGTNWVHVYSFPRITATGIYSSPALPLIGNRVRYVQTIGGTTPSFTRSIARLQSSQPNTCLRQLINRTLDPNTLNSTTTNLNVVECGNQVKLVVNIGAVTVTAPQIQLEGSEDNATTWTAIGSPLTGVASSTVALNASGQNWQWIRARVSTAGVGVTAGWVLIKAHD